MACRWPALGLLLCLGVLPESTGAQSVVALMEKGEALLFVSPDSSRHYYHQAERVASTTGPQDSLFFIYTTLNGFYQINGDQELEGRYAKLLLQVVRNDYERVMALVTLARYYEKVNHNRCDSLYREAGNLASRISSPVLDLAIKANHGQYKLLVGDFYGGIADLIEVTKLEPSAYVTVQVYNKIAMALLFVDRPGPAERYARKSIELANENGYQYAHGMPLVTLAGVRKKNGEYAVALDLLSGVVDSARAGDQHVLLVTALISQASVFRELGQDAQVRAALKEAKTVAPHISNTAHSNLLNAEGQWLLEKGKFHEALATGRQVEELMDHRTPLPARQKAYANMAQALENMGDYRNSLRYAGRARLLEDSIFRSRQTYYFNELEARFNRNQQNQELALLDARNNLQTVRIKQQSRFLLYGGMGGAAILGLLVFLAHAVGKVRTQNSVISATLDEKELLMQEIHHRVKNNLQLISSLLSLQSRYVKDPEAREVLRVGKDRVRSMSIIHQDLYRQENLTAVNVRDYFGKLGEELVKSYEQFPGQILLRQEVEPMDLDVDSLVPLGLIVNELLTNACKYAFSQGSQGQIWLSLREEDANLLLEVRDDGVGFDEADIKSSSFGHKLIRTLIRQLDGSMQKVGQQGTHFRLRFADYRKF